MVGRVLSLVRCFRLPIHRVLAGLLKAQLLAPTTQLDRRSRVGSAAKNIVNPNSRHHASKNRTARTSTFRDQTMNRYEPSAPRTACSIAAIAMTAMTIGLLVVVPTKMDSGSLDFISLATAKAATPAATEVIISPARIDVVAVREPNTVVQTRNVASKRKQPS